LYIIEVHVFFLKAWWFMYLNVDCLSLLCSQLILSCYVFVSLVLTSAQAYSFCTTCPSARGLHVNNMVPDVPIANNLICTKDLSLLGDVAGKVSRGLSPDTVASLPSQAYRQALALHSDDKWAA
jgi:hypothetical protein